MSPNLFSNIADLDRETIGSALRQFGRVTVQYSSNPTASTLEQVSRLAGEFGEGLTVRFFQGSSSSEPWDASLVEHLPEVRSLAIDTHAVSGLEVVARLERLSSLRIGAYEGVPDDLLHLAGLQRLSKLSIGGQKTNRVDLAPVAAMANLKELSLAGQSRALAKIAGAASIESLALHGVPHSVSLEFVGQMTSLSRLAIGFGSRASIREIAHARLQTLLVLRVRGLTELSLEQFPCLETLGIEDQLQIDALDIRPCGQLRKLWIMTCKSLADVLGVEEADSLRELAVGRTAVDLSRLADQLNSQRIERLMLFFGAVGRDKVLAAQLREIGLDGLPKPSNPWF